MKRLVPHDAILIPQHAERVFSGVLFDVYQWQQELFDGTTTTYEMLRRPDTVVILAVQDNKLVMLEEQQAGRPQFLRFPGGRVEAGEGWQEAAQREMQEETGLRFKEWRLVKVEQLETKIEWFVAVYLAFGDVDQGLARQDAGERGVVVLKDLEEVKRLFDSDDNVVLKYSKRLFDKVHSLNQLRNLPAFKGKEI